VDIVSPNASYFKWSLLSGLYSDAILVFPLIYFIGLYIGEIFNQECIAFTTGGLLYLAICGLLGGELRPKNGSMLTIIVYLGFMSLGLIFMYVFALME
jgi:hypothetical protein